MPLTGKIYCSNVKVNVFTLAHTEKHMLDEESDQEFCNFVVPNEYFPGIVLISKVALNDERIINIITKLL